MSYGHETGCMYPGYPCTCEVGMEKSKFKIEPGFSHDGHQMTNLTFYIPKKAWKKFKAHCAKNKKKMNLMVRDMVLHCLNDLEE